VKGRTRYINLLHALFVHKGHTTLVRKNLATSASRQEAIKQLSGQELEEAQWILKHLELHDSRIKELKEKIKQEATEDLDMKNVQSIAGVGVIVAYAFVAHVGDARRFSSAKQVSNYLGFAPRLDYSGTIQRQGHITKHGNSYVRGLIVQAVWSLIRSKDGAKACRINVFGEVKQKV
jgi:transposase